MFEFWLIRRLTGRGTPIYVSLRSDFVSFALRFSCRVTTGEGCAGNVTRIT
jgi:hypothetical protein